MMRSIPDVRVGDYITGLRSMSCAGVLHPHRATDCVKFSNTRKHDKRVRAKACIHNISKP